MFENLRKCVIIIDNIVESINHRRHSMSIYTGAKCIICNKEFTENDDVVVCPECGTPYHRECYEKEGRCINEKLHEEKKSWTEDMSDSDDENALKKCSQCGKMNKPHSIVCEQCGAFLVDGIDQNQGIPNPNMGNNPFTGMNFNPNDKYCGMDPDEEFEDVKLSDTADFIGTNKLYYLTLFKKFKETGKKISLNIICFLFPQLYFANRKMWAETLLSVFVSFITSVSAVIYYFYAMDISAGILEKVNVNSKSFEAIYEISNFILIAFKIVMCLLANWLYYRHTIRKIKSIRTSGIDENAATAKIKASGGTSAGAIFIALGIQFVLTMILIYLFVYI